MQREFVLDISGKQGIPGEKGDDGLPGVNAIPTVDAVAAYVEAPTATQAAVDARVSRRIDDSYLQNIAAFCDSLGEGNQDGSGVTFPDLLAAALARTGGTVANFSKSGWTSTEIAARQGGMPFTLGAFSLPAGTGATAVTVTAPVAAFRTGPINVYPSWLGVLNSGGTLIPGRLRHTIDSGATILNGWTFERTTAGSAVSIPAGATFRSTEFEDYRDWTQIILSARNNIDDLATVMRDDAAMVDWMTKSTKKFLVLSVTTSVTETTGTAGHTKVKAINDARAATWGSRYLDVRRYLIDHGLALNGITPTAADLAAIAGDTIPPSLLVPDGLHPNRFGYRAIADAVLTRLRELSEPATVALSLPNPSHRWDAGTLVGGDGTQIASWAPTHGSVSLAQSTMAAQPKLLTSGGRKYVEFDGIDDMLEGLLNLTQACTIMIRAKVRSLAVVQGLVWPAGSGVTLTVETPGAFRAAGTANFATPNGQVVAGSEYVFTAVLDGPRSALQVAANSAVTGDVGTGGVGTMRVGYAFSGSARYGSITVAEIRIYPLALAPTEIAEIRSRM